MFEVKAIAHALHYLITKYSGNKEKIANRMAILKLFFFAQRYHLRAYGRLIAKDRFVAMDHGPVSSIALDIMRENFYQVLEDDKKFSQKIIHSFDDRLVQALGDVEDYDELSDTDLEALNFALENFGRMDQWELVDSTHEYREWGKHKKELKNKKCVDMDILDFFGKNPPDSPYDSIPQAQVDLNKKWFTGDFE
ncbi:Panacea domain-containing protein [Campylobacter concisus]|uniref:Panacea domain-containing protein n=1 Tax=Campylobacter concisus TaxID=199 RepID=UPI000D30446A|nr:Panacea domain-containing protein [Campylobacter concisus]